jgi:hypothetical protein
VNFTSAFVGWTLTSTMSGGTSIKIAAIGYRLSGVIERNASSRACDRSRLLMGRRLTKNSSCDLPGRVRSGGQRKPDTVTLPPSSRSTTFRRRAVSLPHTAAIAPIRSCVPGVDSRLTPDSKTVIATAGCATASCPTISSTRTISACVDFRNLSRAGVL